MSTCPTVQYENGPLVVCPWWLEIVKPYFTFLMQGLIRVGFGFTLVFVVGAIGKQLDQSNAMMEGVYHLHH